MTSNNSADPITDEDELQLRVSQALLKACESFNSVFTPELVDVIGKRLKLLATGIFIPEYGYADVNTISSLFNVPTATARKFMFRKDVELKKVDVTFVASLADLIRTCQTAKKDHPPKSVGKTEEAEP